VSHSLSPLGHRSIAISVGFALPFVLGACASSATPSPEAGGMASMSMETTASTEPSTAPSPSGPLRCAVTPDATPSATIAITTDKLGIFQFGEPVTIKAGEAVLFSNGNGSPHTITQGTYGKADADACVNEPLASSQNLIVTFYLAGEYPITCRPHPIMQTSVTVE
jgi:plastocyanin